MGLATVALCTSDGNVSVWPRMGNDSEPLQARISQEVTCLASMLSPTQDLCAVCGTADGRLYRVDCIAQTYAATNTPLTVMPLQPAEVTYDKRGDA